MIEPQPAPPWETGTDGLPQVQGVTEADVVIVGAGLAGLSTAYHLRAHAPDLDIAVVDADRPGAGASGRGTGLLGPRVGPPVDKAVRTYGPAVARRMYRVSEEAVALALELCRALGVPVQEGEQLMIAGTAGGQASLARQAAAYRSLGLDVPALSAARLRKLVGLPLSSALSHRNGAVLDPSALTAALARAGADKGVRLYGSSPLLQWEAGAPRGARLTFPRGTIRTGAAVLAVNAQAGRLRLPVGTVVPLEVRALATEPLGAEARALFGEGTITGIVGAEQLSPYMRLTPDGRLVMGGGAVALADGGPGSGRGREETWRWLEQHMSSLHPLLGATAVMHRWSGTIGVTLDGLPVVGRVGGAQDVWYVGGCCGHGLAMSVAHGAHLARALLGGAPETLPWWRPTAPWLPLRGPGRAALRGHLAWLGRQARRDRPAVPARRDPHDARGPGRAVRGRPPGRP